MTNWAGNVTFDPARMHRPGSVDELRRLVAGSTGIRALGSGHSFSRLLEAPGDVVSTAGLPPEMDLDPDRATVTVGAGVRYGELAAYLHGKGHALANLGSLPHISVAGSCATGTHGSGDRNRCLAAAVSAVDLVTADGDLVTVRRDEDGFTGLVVGLGAVGIVVRLALDVVPAFDLRQYVYENLPRERLAHDFAEVFASGYSVSAFTRWTGDWIDQVWVKRRTDDAEPPREWLGATLADGARHPIRGLPPEHATEQLGVPGPWHTRLPHFRPEFVPSIGAELQSEFLLPRERAVEALAAVDSVGARIVPVLQVGEVRTVAGDELWLSPCYRRDTVALHFTWVADADAVAPALAALEEALDPLGARPHWGKLFGAGPDVLRPRYPRWADFAALLRRYDPGGKFRNEFLDRYFPA
jgi:xylitol oxidase